MRVWVLGSGSRGNAVLVETRGIRLLVDAGYGTRTLAQRLQATGVEPESIDACIVTHDHSDHARGAAAAVRKWFWPLFATPGTAASACLADTPLRTFTPGATLQFDDVEVRTFATPHDATEPVGLTVTDTRTGARAGICYDVGRTSDAVRALCSDVDVLVLESNYEEGMLWAGPYPPWLCQRIAGGSGHLSNKAAAELARESVSKRLAHVVLAHISEQNNTPATAYETTRRALARTRFSGSLSTALQDVVSGPFLPFGQVMEAQRQLSLF